MKPSQGRIRLHIRKISEAGCALEQTPQESVHSTKPDKSSKEVFGQRSQAHDVTSEMSFSELGVGLDYPDETLPTQHIL